MCVFILADEQAIHIKFAEKNKLKSNILLQFHSILISEVAACLKSSFLPRIALV